MRCAQKTRQPASAAAFRHGPKNGAAAISRNPAHPARQETATARFRPIRPTSTAQGIIASMQKTAEKPVESIASDLLPPIIAM